VVLSTSFGFAAGYVLFIKWDQIEEGQKVGPY
jgi:hypothetical protein